MCGLAGIISKERTNLGQDLLNMLAQIEHRGRDATGFAVYEHREHTQIRVSMSGPNLEQSLEEMISTHGEIKESRTYRGEGIFTFYEGSILVAPDLTSELHWDIDSHPEFCVHSVGPKLKVYKDQGTAPELQKRHEIHIGSCSHGIGHVRLATESVDNINFAHPFITYLYPELAIVHNGQFTNYFNTRRMLENQGIRFKTNNDSEMAAHYLAWLMTEKGRDLEGAVHAAMDHFDGIFTILAAIPNQLAAFRDRLGIKPILYYEVEDGGVLLGTEQIALTPIVSDVCATELEPGGVKIWSV